MTPFRSRRVFVLAALAIVTSSPALWSQRPSSIRTLETNDSYGLSLRHPEAWSALRRGDQIVLWTTASAIAGHESAPDLETLEADATKVRDSVIVTVTLTSGVDQTLADYAAYVTEYAAQHPIQYVGERAVPVLASDVAKLRLPHVVRGGQLFVQLAPSQVAIVEIRVNARSETSAVRSLKQQAINIILTLERRR